MLQQLCWPQCHNIDLKLWWPSGLLCWQLFVALDVTLNLVFHFFRTSCNLVFLSIFPGLAAQMSADIAQNLWSLVCNCCNCYNSYCTFHLFPLLIFFQIGSFLCWIQSINPIFLVSLYDNGSPYFFLSLDSFSLLWTLASFSLFLWLYSANLLLAATSFRSLIVTCYTWPGPSILVMVTLFTATVFRLSTTPTAKITPVPNMKPFISSAAIAAPRPAYLLWVVSCFLISFHWLICSTIFSTCNVPFWKVMPAHNSSPILRGAKNKSNL